MRRREEGPERRGAGANNRRKCALGTRCVGSSGDDGRALRGRYGYTEGRVGKGELGSEERAFSSVDILVCLIDGGKRDFDCIMLGGKRYYLWRCRWMKGGER